MQNTVNATGSAKSIRHWSEKTEFDKNQAQAFEIIVSSFVLTYFKEAEQNNGQDGLPIFSNRRDSTLYRKQRKYLENMQQQTDDQLIMFMT